MKKFKIVTIFSLIFICVLTFCFTGTLKQKNVYATTNKTQHVIVVGRGEVEAEPDSVKISFGLKGRGETLQAGQTKIKEAISQVTNQIKQYNNSIEVYTNYLSTYPVFENGLLSYEFDCCLIAKSNSVKDVEDLTEVITKAGATSVYGVNYLLSNNEEYYVNALVKAKENAENKVKAIFENASLVGLKEECVYNYYEGNKGEKIKIVARVHACYKVGEEKEDVNGATKVTNNLKQNNQLPTQETNANSSLETGSKVNLKNVENKTNLTNNSEEKRQNNSENISKNNNQNEPSKSENKGEMSSKKTLENDEKLENINVNLNENKSNFTNQNTAQNTEKQVKNQTENNVNNITKNDKKSNENVQKTTENARQNIANNNTQNGKTEQENEQKLNNSNDSVEVKNINNASETLASSKNNIENESLLKTQKTNAENFSVVDANGNIVVELI